MKGRFHRIEDRSSDAVNLERPQKEGKPLPLPSTERKGFEVTSEGVNPKEAGEDAENCQGREKTESHSSRKDSPSLETGKGAFL